LIVGRAVPWWGMVIARLDLRIHSILLYDLRMSSLVSAYFGSSVPIRFVTGKGRSDLSETRAALTVCKVVALERLPGSSESLWDMWSCPSVRLILVAHVVNYLSHPPDGDYSLDYRFTRLTNDLRRLLEPCPLSPRKEMREREIPEKFVVFCLIRKSEILDVAYRSTRLLCFIYFFPPTHPIVHQSQSTNGVGATGVFGKCLSALLRHP
jgi:hypothetical protein